MPVNPLKDVSFGLYGWEDCGLGLSSFAWTAKSVHSAVDSMVLTCKAVVNEKLPQIVEEVKKGTETLSGVAEDVELIKSVAGIQAGRDRGVRSLAVYANEIQEVLAEQTADKEAVILIEEIFGSDLKEVEPAEEFLIGLNKEMLVILPLAKSKQEILFRACHSSPPRRKPFYIKIGDAEPVSLEEFIKQHHAESAELPAFEP